jgi:hypothetical protein
MTNGQGFYVCLFVGMNLTRAYEQTWVPKIVTGHCRALRDSHSYACSTIGTSHALYENVNATEGRMRCHRIQQSKT